MTRFAPLLAVAAALAACAPSPEARTETASPEVPTAMSQDSMELRRFPQDVEAGFRHHSGMESPAREVVRDAEAWASLWPRLSASRGGAAPAPSVDFARDMALVAAMGQRSSGGYEVRIESVERTGSSLVVRVVETSPGPTCGTTGALTSPADVVLVPRSTLPVQWTARQAVTDCG